MRAAGYRSAVPGNGTSRVRREATTPTRLTKAANEAAGESHAHQRHRRRNAEDHRRCRPGRGREIFVYGYYASYIGRPFLPNSSPVASLMLSLATFGVGYLMRPLPGMTTTVFGPLAPGRSIAWRISAPDR